MEIRYRDWNVEKCIGQGSFGKVYKITREDFGHIYESALKVIKVPQNEAETRSMYNQGMSEENVREYFADMVEEIVDEFALMSKMKGNSNIVSYEDHAVIERKDSFGWDIYIQMELLTPLLEYLKTNELSLNDIVRMGIDICKALEVCEKYNIIHRDIKPENIFISNVGTYKLGDFGIARTLEKTSWGFSQKGTIGYMAPEVYQGKKYNYTVDIYSLGIVLYRFLNNNRLPFMPNAPQIIKYSDKEKADMMRMNGEPMPMPVSADKQLGGIILKACAYNPSDRYEDISEMRKDLEQYLSGYTENKNRGLSNLSNISQEKEYRMRQQSYKKGDENRKKVEYENVQYDLNSKPVQKEEIVDLTDEKTVFLFEGEHTSKEEHISKGDNTVKGKEVLGEKKEKSFSWLRTALWICIGLLCVLIFTLVKILQNDSSGDQKVEKEIKNYVTETPVRTEEPTKEPTKEPTIAPTAVQKEMPDVVNMKEKEAKEKLEELGLIVKREKNYSNEITSGKVISQSIKKGEKITEGEEVLIKISKGKKTKVKKKEVSTEETVQTSIPNVVTEAPQKSESVKTKATSKPKKTEPPKKTTAPKKSEETESQNVVIETDPEVQDNPEFEIE